MKTAKYHPLADTHDEEEQAAQVNRTRYGTTWNISTILAIVLAMSSLLNIFMWRQTVNVQSTIKRSTFSGLAYDTPLINQPHNEYWGENETLADELWDDLNTDTVAVQFSDEYAREHDLPRSARFPWDDSKGVYFIKALHEIHCLKNIRKFGKEMYYDGTTTVPWEHFQHCVDSLRQDVVCRADDTPLYSQVGKFPGAGQTVMCRDWDQLIKWIKAPERHACYTQFGDFRPVMHPLEQYAFCPPESPYYELSNAYFEKWGHKDPFSE